MGWAIEIDFGKVLNITLSRSIFTPKMPSKLLSPQQEGLGGSKEGKQWTITA